VNALDIVFEHACKMGLEGIVSKRLGSRYRSGRTSDWLKFKNPGSARGGLSPGCLCSETFGRCGTGWF